MQRIELARYDFSNHYVAKAFEAARTVMPRNVTSATWSYGRGPWNSFLIEDQNSHITFRMADGSTIVIPCRDLDLAMAREDLNRGWMVDLCREIFPLNTNLCLGHLLGTNHAMALILRPAAIVLMRTNYMRNEPTQSRYIPSPLAGGHELLEDPALLEHEFPGRFAIRNEAAR